MVGKILYATDHRRPSSRVLDGLSGFRDIGFKKIIFLCVIKDRPEDVTPELLEQWKEKLNSYGLEATIKIDSGNLSSSVLKTIHENQISFAVVHFNKKKRRILFGDSIVKKLIKEASVPVLIVDEDETGLKLTSKGAFERVLFATDWSQASEKAFQIILGFKQLIKELDIVNVIHKKLTVRELRQLMERLRETRNKCLKEGIDAEYHVYAGKTVDEIILAAQDYNSTSIVMGSTSGQRFKDIFIGKHSCRVVERTPVPALLVP
ncbi:MAG: universal stress protein, partial [Thermodesulfobacteriota bacterium]|nr:universal stress protein [Thermodesulfobacteriota bacterium]